MDTYEKRRRFHELTNEIRENVMRALRGNDIESFHAVHRIDGVLDMMYDVYAEATSKINELEDVIEKK